MDLTFVKRSGKYDELTISPADGTTERIACPKQGIIPHDMIHVAVESVLAHRGFLTLVAQGQAVGFDTGGAQEDHAVERLVEVFQAEMWGGRVPVADLIATYEHACAARGHDAATISAEDVAAIRARLDELTGQWADVPIDGGLTVTL